MKTDLTSNQAASPNLAPQGLAKRRTKMFARFLASFVKYFLISCFGVAFLLPFLWLVSSSLKTSGQEVCVAATMVAQALSLVQFCRSVFVYSFCAILLEHNRHHHLYCHWINSFQCHRRIRIFPSEMEGAGCFI